MTRMIIESIRVEVNLRGCTRSALVVTHTYLAPCMLCCRLEVTPKLNLGPEAQQTGKAHELMADRVVILVMVSETPIVVEGA